MQWVAVKIDIHEKLTNQNREIGKMLGSMINNPGPFIIKSDLRLLNSGLWKKDVNRCQKSVLVMMGELRNYAKQKSLIK